MDVLTFLTFLSFQITVVALTAISLNQSKLAEKAIAGLVKLSGKPVVNQLAQTVKKE